MPSGASGLYLASPSPALAQWDQLLDIREKVFGRQALSPGPVPCQFYPLEERLHEQKASRYRHRGGAGRTARAGANRERGAVRTHQYR